MNSGAMFKKFNERQQLSSIIMDLVKRTDPEKILLVTARYDYKLTENIFIKNAMEECTGSHYTLLVLGRANKFSSAIRQLALSGSRYINPPNLQLFFMDILDFNRELETHGEHAANILLNATIWYDKGEIAFSFPKPAV
jgi:hypothetical protein